MHAEQEREGIRLAMSTAEVVALREAVAFADFAGDLPDRHPGELKVLSRLLQTLDPLIPELGTDSYDAAVESAWRAIDAGQR